MKQQQLEWIMSESTQTPYVATKQEEEEGEGEELFFFFFFFFLLVFFCIRVLLS